MLIRMMILNHLTLPNEVVNMNSKVKLCWAKPSATLLRTLGVVAFSAIFGTVFFILDVVVSKLAF